MLEIRCTEKQVFLCTPEANENRRFAMSEVYGYARCSTNEEKQDINRQIRELVKYGVPKKNIFSEYESGTKDDRLELARLLDTVVEDDVIVTLEISRLARSTAKLCDILSQVQKKQIKLEVPGKLTLDCRPGHSADPGTLAMTRMLGVFAELERDLISERVKSGMANARAKGHYPGRPKTTIDRIPKGWMKYYAQYKAGNLNKSELSRLYDCSRTTTDRYIKIIEGADNV